MGWNSVASIRGPQGLQGDPGPTGGTGSTGAKGDKGDPGDPATATTNASALTSGTVAYARLPVGTGSNTVAAGNDSRLTDARTPTAHTHGQDAVTVSSTGVNYATSITLTAGTNVAVSRFTITATGNPTITPSTSGAVDGQVMRVVVLASGATRTVTVASAVGLSTGITDRALAVTSGQVGVFGFEYISALSKWILFSEYVTS